MKKIVIAFLISIATLQCEAHDSNSVYDERTGTVTIQEVEVNGIVKYVGVRLQMNPNGTLSIINYEKLSSIDDQNCIAYAAGTSYCIDGKYPTCNTENVDIQSIIPGMSYNEVIDIMGCHGVLQSRSKNTAAYLWGEEDGYDHGMIFVDGKVTSFF